MCSTAAFGVGFCSFRSRMTEVGEKKKKERKGEKRRRDGEREKPATWRSFARVVEIPPRLLIAGQTEEKLFHMRNCARPAFAGKFSTVFSSLFSPPSRPPFPSVLSRAIRFGDAEFNSSSSFDPRVVTEQASKQAITLIAFFRALYFSRCIKSSPG